MSAPTPEEWDAWERSLTVAGVAPEEVVPFSRGNAAQAATLDRLDEMWGVNYSALHEDGNLYAFLDTGGGYDTLAIILPDGSTNDEPEAGAS